ncbi:hypothetical protein [Pseudoxanthomonas sp. JBR18]|uniref:hypothetical protein n=1 Tax=Pseudoxanthomonas sp. JBR18 TaxID=2969308 RepID=UPI0023064FFE|nr:hypothetical protein [Pseudoxanthomonas sp. JBR18]WCE03606.1 hypothetical protein PJ250_16140 [Pseudoxanthomonas sp. JBR18]
MYEYEDAIAEYDEYEDYDEAARPRFRPRPVAVPRRGNVVPAANSSRPVTHADLVNASRRLDEKIGTNARAIKSIESRVNTVATQTGRQAKAMEEIQGDVKSLREVSMLLPLLSTQKTANVSGTEVLVPTNDTFSRMLPILLMSGGGGLTGSPGTTDTTGLGGIGLPLLLVMAMQK